MQGMKRCMFPVLALLTLFYLGGSTGRGAEDQDLIDGGAGVGKVRLGARESLVIDLLGQPPYKDAMMGEAWDDWHDRPIDGGPVEEMNLLLHHDENAPAEWCVWQITVTFPIFHTREGISTTSDVAAIWRVYPGLVHIETEEGGDGTQLELYDLRERGIGFLIERNPHPKEGESWGKCRAVVVHRNGVRARFDRVGKQRR